MAAIEVRIIEAVDERFVGAAVELYEAVGWTAYTQELEVLAAGLRGSSFLAAAFDGPALVGLVRVVSDDATISYVQDLLVHPDVQRRGIGAALMAAVARRYAHLRQHVLLTDDEVGQRAFYESMGYLETRDFRDGTLRAFVRFQA